MNVVGLCGFSNAGKTTLAAKLIAALRETGARVSAVKHAHAGFDMDRPGKDSHRMREAGAFEVVVGSGRRLAVLREFEVPLELSIHHLLAQITEPEDRPLWVVAEGFRHMDQLKLEFWEPAPAGTPQRNPLYVEDPFVVGIVCDHPQALPEPTGLPVFSRDEVAPIVAFLLANQQRFEYRSPYAPAPDVKPPPLVATRWSTTHGDSA
jgi:molybdopterin-guanine dinucleotide biosynthesis adapter protein